MSDSPPNPGARPAQPPRTVAAKPVQAAPGAAGAAQAPANPAPAPVSAPAPKPAPASANPAPGAPGPRAVPAAAQPAPAGPKPVPAAPKPAAPQPAAPKPAAQQPPQQKTPMRPPASQSRLRSRHWFAVLSFLVMVVLPAALTWFYLYTRAADQYASNLGFSVRKEETSSAVELLGGITELSGSSSSDTDILFSYLSSQELVRKIDDQVDLRAIWSRVSTDRDPIFAFDPDSPIEKLLSHWERKVSIIYDSGAGLIDVRVLAFDPVDARRVANALFEECSRMINELSAIAREDAIKFSREELERAVERLKTARRAINEFRNRTQIVDPTIDTQSQMGLLTTLQQQLAESLIELDLLRETTRTNDPRISQAERRVEVINARIDAERQKLGLGDSAGQDDVFANLVGEYEGLVVDREFAEQAYTAALASYDASTAEARKQSRYLAAHIRPTLAESAEYPARVTILSVSSVFLFLIWSLVVLTFYSLRDRR